MTDHWDAGAGFISPLWLQAFHTNLQWALLTEDLPKLKWLWNLPWNFGLNQVWCSWDIVLSADRKTPQSWTQKPSFCHQKFSVCFLHSPCSHNPWIFSRGGKKILWTFFFFFLDIKYFQSSWTCRRVSETLHQHVPLGNLDSIYLVLWLTEDCIWEGVNSIFLLIQLLDLTVLQTGGFSYPQQPANWKDLPTWMFQKPAACFKIIPRRLKINRHCDKDGCSSRFPSEILMSSDSVLDSRLPQNGKGLDKSLLSLNENLKAALLSNESFYSTAVRSWFLFTPLPKVIFKQTGHLPLPYFNKDYSILNLMPVLAYDTEKNLWFQRRKLQEDKDKQKQRLFSVQLPTVFVFQGREGGAMWPCFHLITPVGASRSQQQPHSSCSSYMATFLVLSSYPASSLRHRRVF